MLGQKKLKTFFLFLITVMTAQTAYADQANRMPPEKDWTVVVGIAGMYSSTLQGPNDYTFSIVPDLQLKYKEDFFASIPEGIGYNIITRSRGQSGWKIGPLAKIRFKRDDEDKSPFVVRETKDKFRGMGNIDTAIEVGGFMDYKWNVLKSRLELRRGFGGHQGLIADLRVSYNNNFGPLRFGFGPGINWADAGYNQTYYGVNSLQATQTGLEEYKPRTGIISYGVGGFAIMPVSATTVITFFAGYDMLVGDAKNSPVVRRYNSQNQITLGLGFGYQFGFDL